ncbi:uncharacterized protein [Palaemon carinicauda]|uniref:uncharacterized protein n=1 Tax=Palaemon carinicauda TaxID=392227 RepID=UPI0035B593E4
MGNIGRTLMLLMLVAMITRDALGKRTCFVSLRLKTTKGHFDRDIEDFTTRAFLGSCSKVERDCPGRLLEHVSNIFGPEVNPMKGDTSINMCKLFGMEILPEHNPDVDVKYKASSCGNEGYMGIGNLCCFKCAAGPYTFYHPINNCAPTERPAWCLPA